MRCHPSPGRDIVVSAVDPGHIHTCGNQPRDELRIVGGLARHGHHDSSGPPGGCDTKKLVGVAGKKGVPFGEANTRRRCCWRSPGQAGEKGEDGLDRGEDVRFAAAQGGKPEAAKAQLEIAYVMVAQLHVVDEVRRRLPMQWVGRLDLVGPARLGRQQGVTQVTDLGPQFAQVARTTNITHARDARSRRVNVTWRLGERLSPGRRLPASPLADSRATSGPSGPGLPRGLTGVPVQPFARARRPGRVARSGRRQRPAARPAVRDRSHERLCAGAQPERTSAALHAERLVATIPRWRGATAVARVRSIVGIDQPSAAGSGSCGSAGACRLQAPGYAGGP